MISVEHFNNLEDKVKVCMSLIRMLDFIQKSTVMPGADKDTVLFYEFQKAQEITALEKMINGFSKSVRVAAEHTIKDSKTLTRLKALVRRFNNLNEAVSKEEADKDLREQYKNRKKEEDEVFLYLLILFFGFNYDYFDDIDYNVKYRINMKS